MQAESRVLEELAAVCSEWTSWCRKGACGLEETHRSLLWLYHFTGAGNRQVSDFSFLYDVSEGRVCVTVCTCPGRIGRRLSGAVQGTFHTAQRLVVAGGRYRGCHAKLVRVCVCKQIPQLTIFQLLQSRGNTSFPGQSRCAPSVGGLRWWRASRSVARCHPLSDCV